MPRLEAGSSCLPSGRGAPGFDASGFLTSMGMVVKFTDDIERHDTKPFLANAQTISPGTKHAPFAIQINDDHFWATAGKSNPSPYRHPVIMRA